MTTLPVTAPARQVAASSASSAADPVPLATAWNLSEMRRHRADGEPIWTPRDGAFLLVLGGQIVVRLDDTCIVLEAGDAALLGPGRMATILSGVGSDVVVGDLHPVVPVAGVPQPLVVRDFSTRFEALRMLVETCPLGNRCGATLWTRAYAGMLGAAMLTAWGEDSPDTVQDAAVSAVVDALTRAPGEPWTLERMARLAHLSRSALTARFHAALGVAPSDVLRDLRMHEAREQLSLAQHPIGTIALSVGYGSTAAFSRAFSAHHGVGPQAWRDARRARDAQSKFAPLMAVKEPEPAFADHA